MLFSLSGLTLKSHFVAVGYSDCFTTKKNCVSDFVHFQHTLFMSTKLTWRQKWENSLSWDVSNRWSCTSVETLESQCVSQIISLLFLSLHHLLLSCVWIKSWIVGIERETYNTKRCIVWVVKVKAKEWRNEVENFTNWNPWSTRLPLWFPFSLSFLTHSFFLFVIF